MQGITEAQAGWLRRTVTEMPRSGNTILVTHQSRDQRRGREGTFGVAGCTSLYLHHRFREDLDHLELQNHWKFLQIWLA